MKMVGYIRVSTDEQAREGKSLAIQGAQINHYCDLHNHDLDFVYIDFGVSASIDLGKRPGGQAMMSALNGNNVGGVVFQRVDRMFRIAVDGLLVARWFLRKGLAVQSINEGIDINTSTGWMVFTMMLATAEYERNKIADRGREVTAGLKLQNKVWGHVPFGCIQDDNNKLFRCPATWHLRQWIQAMRDDEKLTYKAIAETLWREGIAAPSGGREWYASTVMGLVKTFHSYNHIPMLAVKNDAPDSTVMAVAS